MLRHVFLRSLKATFVLSPVILVIDTLRVLFRFTTSIASDRLVDTCGVPFIILRTRTSLSLIQCMRVREDNRCEVGERGMDNHSLRRSPHKLKRRDGRPAAHQIDQERMGLDCSLQAERVPNILNSSFAFPLSALMHVTTIKERT